MKIGFCFIIKNEINNEKIWFDYFNNKDNYELLIHCSEENNLEYLNNLTDKIYINAVYTKWGCLQIVQNFLMEKCKELDCKKFIILSDSCLPIKSFDFFYKNMFNDKCFIKYSELWDNTRFPIKYDWLKGNHQWCIIDSSKYDIFLDSEHRNYFEYSVHIPEESYYSSILNEKNLLNDDNVINELSTFVEWNKPQPGKNPPYYFDSFNREENNIISSCLDNENYFFLRKVSEINNEEIKKIIYKKII